MTDIVLARRFPAAVGAETLGRMLALAAECMALHDVVWQHSMLALDGRRMLCHFRAPDAESARLALRRAEGEVLSLWPASVHGPPTVPGPPASVVVERSFPRAVRFADIQAREDAHAWCLEAHQVRFVRSYFSRSRRHMFCLYQAPDAESVRIAQRQAGMPVERIWAGRPLTPDGPAAVA